jgi:hypothetical protein
MIIPMPLIFSISAYGAESKTSQKGSELVETK